ncbi:MAG TPA: TetR/AcrR family transcriptional regulator [Solirubrobacteraceae bacterium]|nr:TetR/AcrR family transcriptional regulator [Solirubrobacteraceae bacterium]
MGDEPERGTEDRLERLPAGQHGLNRDQVTESQRRRLRMAMIECVSDRGYAGTKIRDLARIAGVSPNSFYRIYGSKEQCFLDTHDTVAAIEIERVSAAAAGTDPWEQRLHQAIEAFTNTVADAPRPAYLAVVEIHAVGAAALEHQQHALDAHERLMRTVLDDAPYRASITNTTVKAIVAGTRGMIYHHLEEGNPQGLRSLVEPISAWVLGYHAPLPLTLPEPLEALPCEATKLPGDEIARSGEEQARTLGHRERIMRAVAALCCEQGYGKLRVPTITTRAGVSNQTFYEHFKNKHDAFLACYDRVSRRALAAVLASFQAAPSWPEAVRASLGTLLEHIAAEPEFARLGLFEVLAAGPEARRRAQARTEAFTVMLTPGSPGGEVTAPTVMGALVAGGVWGVIQHHIIHGRGARLPELTPQLTYVALTPFIGAAEAARVAAGA